MLRVGLIGWRGMVGSVLLQRMREENDFAQFELEPVFFSTSNVGGAAPKEAGGAPLGDASQLKDLAACDVLASPHMGNPDGTRFFGSPTKLFEYMAMGRAIVASDLEQIGEVLEHVEDPARLLRKLRELCSDDGLVFMTTPTNAPAIDHIYLFRDVQHIRDLIAEAGFDVLDERAELTEETTPKRAAAAKIATLYGALLAPSKT